MNDYNLKPCPFCGGTVKWVHDLDGAVSGLRCPECKGFFRWPRIKTNGNHEPFGVAMDKIAEIWNRRAM